MAVLLTSFLPSDSGMLSALDDSNGIHIEYPHVNPTMFKVHDLLRIAGVVSNSLV